MLIHGLGLDHRMWERQVPALVGSGLPMRAGTVVIGAGTGLGSGIVTERS